VTVAVLGTTSKFISVEITVSSASFRLLVLTVLLRVSLKASCTLYMLSRPYCTVVLYCTVADRIDWFPAKCLCRNCLTPTLPH